MWHFKGFSTLSKALEDDTSACRINLAELQKNIITQGEIGEEEATNKDQFACRDDKGTP